MTVETDSSGKRYVEIATSPEEQVRLTLVPAQEAGYKTESIRIQIRDPKGHLRNGPEVPLTSLGGVMNGIVALLLDHQ